MAIATSDGKSEYTTVENGPSRKWACWWKTGSVTIHTMPEGTPKRR